MMEGAQKPSDSECYTPLSEPFRIYLNIPLRNLLDTVHRRPSFTYQVSNLLFLKGN
jgi:hypothetical protein